MHLPIAIYFLTCNISATWAFFYLVASCCVAALPSESWLNIYKPTAAAVFGFMSMFVYIGLCYLLWKAVKTGQDQVDNIYSGDSSISQVPIHPDI